MSQLKREVEMLRTIPMFNNLPPNKLKLLAFASDRIAFMEGESIFRQGDRADAAYIVISGHADILIDSTTGGEPTKVAELGPNAFVGDMAILSDIPRTATVKARTTLETLRISKDHMMEMIQDSPVLAMAVLKELVARLAKTTQDLSEAREQVKKLSA